MSILSSSVPYAMLYAIYRVNISTEIPVAIYPSNHKVLYRKTIFFDWNDLAGTDINKNKDTSI